MTPPDKVQGNLVRLVYIHPGVAWVALYLAFGLAAVASLLYLWPRTRSLFWDRLAAAAVEVGVVFNVLHPDLGVDLGQADLGGVVGMGRPAHQHRASCWSSSSGTWPSAGCPPTPRCGPSAAPSSPCSPPSTSRSSTSRCCGGRPCTRARPCSTPDLSPTIHGSMAWTLLLGFVALTLVFVWMLLVRYRIGVLEDWTVGRELDVALAERRAEDARQRRVARPPPRPDRTATAPAMSGAPVRETVR